MRTIQTRGLIMEEKCKLVTECGSSGMPASKWLKEHGIYEERNILHLDQAAEESIL